MSNFFLNKLSAGLACLMTIKIVSSRYRVFLKCVKAQNDVVSVACFVHVVKMSVLLFCFLYFKCRMTHCN